MYVRNFSLARQQQNSLTFNGIGINMGYNRNMSFFYEIIFGMEVKLRWYTSQEQYSNYIFYKYKNMEG